MGTTDARNHQRGWISEHNASAGERHMRSTKEQSALSAVLKTATSGMASRVIWNLCLQIWEAHHLETTCFRCTDFSKNTQSSQCQYLLPNCGAHTFKPYIFFSFHVRHGTMLNLWFPATSSLGFHMHGRMISFRVRKFQLCLQRQVHELAAHGKIATVSVSFQMTSSTTSFNSISEQTGPCKATLLAPDSFGGKGWEQTTQPSVNTRMFQKTSAHVTTGYRPPNLQKWKTILV